MSLILLTDIDGNALAINPDFIVSVTAVRKSYHGSKGVIHTQDGKSQTVRQSPEEIFDAIQQSS
ncbi:hypothetical protein LMG3410_02104 [Achromobacter aegrifaciens]|uniref:hypothetical protein n=1 Tax=Achromobacter aegrifaciens TaxID=1287736 RepID=UPI0014653B09|nr:hypothetical protein [Achromobacter aegrifaciens]CAB3857481.1 hypothetical protein LMG3410_02104 [Achromobacter aegrifaciens]